MGFGGIHSGQLGRWSIMSLEGRMAGLGLLRVQQEREMQKRTSREVLWYQDALVSI